ncbi:DNA-directed RNA polymerases IV and V subunit 2-like protein, partial [Tanacetum coccineum]
MAVWTQVVPKTKEAAIHRKPRRTMNASECVSEGWALESTILSPTFKVRDFQKLGQNGKPFASGITRKARYLGYMVKSILEGYTSRRKVDNKDDFGNKRLELAGELLERELKVHLRHAQKRMVKAMQRDLYPVLTIHPIDQYLNAAIISAHG